VSVTYKTFTVSATSPATASTVIAGVFRGLREYDWFTVDAHLIGATGGALDVYLQRKVADDVWVDWLHLPQKAAASAATRHTIDARSVEDGPVVVGIGTDATATPSMAAGKLACAHPGDEVRVVLVAGASTSVGAAQVVRITCWQGRD
jgi:hypothetical protein